MPRGFVLALAVCAIATTVVPNRTALADGSAGPVYYSNGDVANAAPKCSPGEVCATIASSNGDQTKVLTGGSEHCNPYVMTFMRYHEGQLDAVWSTPTDRSPDAQGMMGSHCGGFTNAHMMVQGGVIDMGIFNNKDGTIFVRFFGGSTTKP